ncbi:MAG: acetyl-CoA carboxylase biotin carboxyl carrier [Treponematales bacterium]
MNEKLIFTLIEKFEAGTMAELEYSDGESKLLLKKEAPRGNAVDASAGSAHDDGAHGQKGAVRLGLPVRENKDGEVVTSPIVATFYNSPAPDAPPFVKPGSKVKTGDTLCVLEAMKMMNRLEAEFDCEIVSVEADNGALVEYGQALFRVKRL